jgi:hypothetical protein
LGTGKSFAAGPNELLKVTFRAIASKSGAYLVSFTNRPVKCEVSDATALALATSYASSTVTVNPFPSLKISLMGSNIALAWPLWASNFALQEAESPLPLQALWSNLPVTGSVSNTERIVTLPLTSPSKFYRLYRP